MRNIAISAFYDHHVDLRKRICGFPFYWNALLKRRDAFQHHAVLTKSIPTSEQVAEKPSFSLRIGKQRLRATSSCSAKQPYRRAAATCLQQAKKKAGEEGSGFERNPDRFASSWQPAFRLARNFANTRQSFGEDSHISYCKISTAGQLCILHTDQHLAMPSQSVHAG